MNPIFHKFLERLGITSAGVPQLIALCESRDGYQREYAVRRLCEIGESVALPALIERANDWVVQVRDAARDAISQLMVPNNALAFVENLPQIVSLARRGRADHGPLLKCIFDYLARPGNRTALESGLRDPNSKLRQACFDIALSSDAFSVADLVCAALADRDPVIQRKAAIHLASVTPEQIDVVLALALRSRNASARYAALQISLQEPVNAAKFQLARESLLDDNSSVRFIAISWLRAHHETVEDTYREVLTNPAETVRRLRAAVLGVAEAGNLATCVNAVRAHGKSSYPSLRRAVLSSMVRLDPDRGQELCLKALEDGAISVVHTACNVLAKLGVSLSTADLLRIASKNTQGNAMRAALTIARRSHKWDRLEFLLRIANTRDTRLNIQLELGDWHQRFNQSFGNPSNDQWHSMRNLLGQLGNMLTDRERHSLLLILEQSKPGG